VAHSYKTSTADSVSNGIFLYKDYIPALAAWSSGIVFTCHQGDQSYGLGNQIPPGFRVLAFFKWHKLLTWWVDCWMSQSFELRHQSIIRLSNETVKDDELLFLQLFFLQGPEIWSRIARVFVVQYSRNGKNVPNDQKINTKVP
jgi:hypothetical protein